MLRHRRVFFFSLRIDSLRQIVYNEYLHYLSVMKGVVVVSKNRRSVCWRIVLILCIALFTASLVMLGLYYLPHLRPVVEAPSFSVSAPADVSEPPLPENPIDFAAQHERNPHIVAWIQIPGTVIDYPVLQSGNDVVENFYLDHNADREPHRAGAIYIQQMNSPDFSDPNTVLYGHYMGNGTMFADLHQFRKEKFFAENEYIYVYTPGHILTYRIYAAFIYDSRHILNAFNFDDPADYNAFLEQTLDPPSMTKQVRQGVEVTTADRIITLSTCTMRDSERYLVEGVLIHDQPTQ